MSRVDARDPCPKLKRAYRSRQAAEQALAAMRRKPKAAARRAYQCPWCLQWHLTSDPVVRAEPGR